MDGSVRAGAQHAEKLGCHHQVIVTRVLCSYSLQAHRFACLPYAKQKFVDTRDAQDALRKERTELPQTADKACANI